MPLYPDKEGLLFLMRSTSCILIITASTKIHPSYPIEVNQRIGCVFIAHFTGILLGHIVVVVDNVEQMGLSGAPIK